MKECVFSSPPRARDVSLEERGLVQPLVRPRQRRYVELYRQEPRRIGSASACVAPFPKTPKRKAGLQAAVHVLGYVVKECSHALALTRSRVCELCLTPKYLPHRVQFANEEISTPPQHTGGLAKDRLQPLHMFQDQHSDNDVSRPIRTRPWGTNVVL